jgi:hypothetical protein
MDRAYCCVGHNEFGVNIWRRKIRKKDCRKTSSTMLKASHQKQLHSDERNGLQQSQMESYQPIKRLEDNNKKTTRTTRNLHTDIHTFT